MPTVTLRQTGSRADGDQKRNATASVRNAKLVVAGSRNVIWGGFWCGTDDAGFPGMPKKAKKNDRILAAKAGDLITFPTTVMVRKACSNKHDGHWFCHTCQQHFEHNFAKDSHIHSGVHMLVWICHEHGPEQP